MYHVRHKHLGIPSWLRGFWLIKEMRKVLGIGTIFNQWLEGNRVIGNVRVIMNYLPIDTS